jgi:hypothetical protein
MYFADIALSPFYCGWNWRTGWAQISIAGSENEGKIEIVDPYQPREGKATSARWSIVVYAHKVVAG